MEVKEITVHALKQKMDANERFQLIDVREAHEYDICNLNGKLIPLQSIPNHVDEIETEKPVIIHCKGGGRSAKAIQYLQETEGFRNLYNLKGGILAWSDEIDPEVPKY